MCRHQRNIHNNINSSLTWQFRPRVIPRSKLQMLIAHQLVIKGRELIRHKERVSKSISDENSRLIGVNIADKCVGGAVEGHIVQEGQVLVVEVIVKHGLQIGRQLASSSTYASEKQCQIKNCTTSV